MYLDGNVPDEVLRQMIDMSYELVLDITVWESLTCIEQLMFMGQMYDVKRKVAQKRGLEILEALGLIAKKDQFAKTLSGGMLRRLNISLALVHKPPDHHS